MLGRFDFMKFFVQQLWEKIVSWFQLFVYIFQKNFLSFSSFGSTGKISLKIADYGEFSILRNFLLGATPPKIVDENFVNLKIHHNQLFVMKYSLWYQNLKKINFFLKNVNKQLKSADIFFPQLSYKKFHKMKSSWRRKVSTRAINFGQNVKK